VHEGAWGGMMKKARKGKARGSFLKKRTKKLLIPIG
jgi:hypothetical protein